MEPAANEPANGHANEPHEEEEHEIRAVETDPSKRYTRVRQGRACACVFWGCERARARR